MSKVAIVTDSVSNLTVQLAKEHGIYLIPFYVLIGDNALKDNEPGAKELLYKSLREDRPVGTSHPTLMDYVDTFLSLKKEGSEILYLTVSESWTISADIAQEAKERIGDQGIEVLDTKTALGHLGLIAIEAAKFAKGKTLREVKEYAQLLANRGNLFCVIDTLKYLAKSGRIGRVRSLLGTALRLRPVLTARDGIADVAAKTFSEKQALKWIFKRLKTERKSLYRGKICISVEIGDRNNWKETIIKSIGEEFPDAKVFELKMSPVVTCHTGPGIWGISYLFP